MDKEEWDSLLYLYNHARNQTRKICLKMGIRIGVGPLSVQMLRILQSPCHLPDQDAFFGKQLWHALGIEGRSKFYSLFSAQVDLETYKVFAEQAKEAGDEELEWHFADEMRASLQDYMFRWIVTVTLPRVMGYR